MKLMGLVVFTYLSDHSDLALVACAATLHQGHVGCQTQPVHVATGSCGKGETHPGAVQGPGGHMC